MSSLRVMSFNIHHGKGTDQKVDLKRIGDFIHKMGAEIIALNEVDKYFSKRSRFVNQAAWIAENLQMNYVFGPAISIPKKDQQKKREFGNACLSKQPIVAAKNHPFDFIPKLLEDRALLEVKIRVGHQPIKILITHLSLAPFLRHRQVQYIKEIVHEESTPVIVMGDFNMKPYSSGWMEMTNVTGLVDICETTKPKTFLTYPSTRPKIKLDYIFTSTHFIVKSVEVPIHASHISDHLPLMADLELKT